MGGSSGISIGRIGVLLTVVLLLLGSGGCGMSAVPHLERGMTRDEVDRHCVQDCFPIFKPVQVGMHGDELDVTYHQDSLVGYGAGQFLFATYKDDQLEDWSLLGVAGGRSVAVDPSEGYQHAWQR